jgi:alpha-galactosidase
MTRIAFIGAGSVEFTRNLLGDILSFPELADAEIVLHDINDERLATAAAMARWTNAAVGARAQISAQLDRRRALDGADFAVNTIEVGGIAATRLDFDIPRKYGLRQTIADTSGVGAVFRALRTIPVMLGIADDMVELCPAAWMLNYANPMAMNCWAWYEGSLHQRIVGLCHSIQNTSRQVAEYVGVPPEEITFLGAGVNHMSWVLRVEKDGESLYPALDAAIAADPDGLGRHVRVEIYKRFGYFPTESSEHFAEYVPWFMRDYELIERLRIPVDEYIRRSEENIGFYEEEKRMLSAGEPFEIGLSGEYASLIIHSMVTGVPRTVYGNVRNTGLITNLPHDACVEVPCLVDKAGLQPTHVGELTVRAALEGRRDHVHQAVLLDPNAAATLSPARIEAMVDELLAAERDMMPEALR